MTPRKVFISYARLDACEIAQRLARDLGSSAWLDVQRLRGGDDWEREIEEALDAADVVLALLSPASYTSDHCRAERQRALKKGKCVIPVLVRPADVHLHLQTRQYLDFTADQPYEERLATLVAHIRAGRGPALEVEYRATNVAAPPLPLTFVPRDEALASLRDAILSDHGARHVALTALEGMGGIGKTLLAQALCHDEVIQDAFPDGIAWVTIGREGERDIVGKLREIGKALSDDLSHYGSHADAVTRYRRVLRERAALVVLDDVWDAQDLEPFRADSPRSMLLFTTRDAGIAGAVGARPHFLELLTTRQSQAFLARWADRSETDLPVAAELVHECGRLPLALAIVGAMLKGKPDALWTVVLDLLRRADHTRIRAQFPDYPHPSVFAAMQVSVDALDGEARRRYLALAVLLEDMSADVAILRALWETDEADALATADQLVTLSLAQRDGHGDAVRLHDLLLDYVRAQHPDRTALKLIHGALRLSAYVSTRDSGQFASQMTGRLLPHAGNPTIQRLLDTIARGAPRPWLRPLFPALLAPGEPLLCTLNMDDVDALAPSVDPRRMIVAGSDGLCALDLEEFRVVPIRPLAYARHVVSHPETGRAVYANGDLLVLWNLTTGADVPIRAPDPISALDMSRDGTRVVAQMGIGVRVWDFAAWQELLAVPTLGRSEAGVAMSPDGRLAVYCLDRDAEAGRPLVPIIVHDLSAGRDLFTLDSGAERIFALSITPEGRWLVAGAGDGTIRTWCLETGRPVHVLNGHTMEVLSLAVTPDGRQIVSGSYDQSVRVWDIDSGRLVRRLGAHSGAVYRVAVSADGRRVVSHAWGEGPLKIWDLETEGLVAPDSHDGFVKGVAFTGDGTAVTASSDGTLKVWSLQTGRVIRTLTGHTDKIASLALSADGRIAVSGSDDGVVNVWDIDTGECRLSLGDHPGIVRSVAISRDARHVATGSDMTRLWDITTETEVARLGRHTCGLALTADGTRLLVGTQGDGGDHYVAIWDIAGARETGGLHGHEMSVVAVVVSPDDRRAVSGSYDGVMKVWDLEARRELLSWKAHDSGIAALAMSPDGRTVASASGDCRLSVWDLDTAARIATFTFDRSGRSVAYGPGGLFAGGDKSGRVYFLSLEW